MACDFTTPAKCQIFVLHTFFFLHSSLCIWASVWTLFYELYMQCFLDIGGNGRLMVKSLSGQVVTAP